ncbi:cryptochrome/photolyase family protein [Simiduia aestuariiviva]|uniref:Deoxyribodipyrimidine photo-lyase n=1 Tax=Simiduia aestuariiviva TaxID=1510459 RepID=A0A839UIZ7_9GAMM|nr:deoxyribodipyrimidine photo-lyase [Simiduia aestuariiviva]MBB3167832.1 deoxyribodipyrimidine photo-lyase [Simiduia aestuariiviva]
MAQLIWFRSDLRIADHLPLTLARQSGEPVYGVFVVTPAQWQQHNVGLPKRDFWARSLIALRAKLASKGIQLAVLSADTFAQVPSVLMAFAKDIGCSRILWHREYGWDERQRDSAVCEASRRAGIATEVCEDRCLVMPESVLTGGGTPYKVFSAFKRNWLAQLADQWRTPAPAIRKSGEVVEQLPSQWQSEIAGFYRDGEDPKQVQALATLWPVGEAEASRRLQHFLSEHVRAYGEARDFPARPGTSQLSPYLSIGSISARQCAAGWLAAAEGDWHDPQLQVWLNELAWRDFYHYVMWHFPKVSRNQPFVDKTRAVAWRHAPDDFDAWCRGDTGIPLVDAAMRQLLATGWMHNRLRMVAAMFLTKNLLIDWRKGEAFFMERLVDADFAANNGGWQWSASTGTDAAPYFRVFNPVSQSQRFDPEGAFIRQWVPELAHLTNKQIHMPTADQRGDYSAPLVDLKFSRQRAIEAFASLS